MTKLELNNKLAELYNLDKGYEYVNENLYSDSITTLLIDDWNSLMDLAVGNGICIDFTNDEEYISAFSVRNNNINSNIFDEQCSDHKSPQAATRFAIAMALVKVAEDKP